MAARWKKFNLGHVEGLRIFDKLYFLSGGDSNPGGIVEKLKAFEAGARLARKLLR